MLKEALREGLTSKHQILMRKWEELNSRKQGAEESLDTYIDDIDAAAAQKLHLTDAEV